MSDLYPNLFKNLTRNPITVILLDGRKQMMVYDKTTKLESLFEETCKLCNLDCDNLFGFATLMDDYYAFLNLDIKVSKINFKEISRKSQNNLLFKSNLTNYTPLEQVFADNRRLSQGNKMTRDNNKFMQSTSSTKSAPVYHLNDTLTAPQNNTPVIYFRVKSYVHSHCLRDRTTKSLYFLQLLRNVLDYRLKCVDEIYLQLGALAIQAFYGDYDSILTASLEDHSLGASCSTDSSDYSHSPSLSRLSRTVYKSFNLTPEEVLSGNYFDPRKYFPSWIIDKYSSDYIFKEIPQLHNGLQGLSQSEAEFSYIRMASAQYSNFNMHLFPVRDQKLSGSNISLVALPPMPGNNKRNGATLTKNQLWLGLSPAGLEMHQMKQTDNLEHISILKWSDIDEVTHKSSRINIRVGCRSLKLHTNTKMQADHLFWLTRHMHMYQTKARLNATCTEEALENAERQKYHEKYVYMDLEDLKLHGLPTTDSVDSSDTASNKDSFEKTPSIPRMPLVNTPAALPRRIPSAAKPLKMKDMIKMANSGNNSNNESPDGSFHTEKHNQYIKKSQPSSMHSINYLPMQHKQASSPGTPTRMMNESPYSSLHNDKTDSDQSTGKITETVDDADITESDSCSFNNVIIKPPGRFVSLSRDLTQDNNLSRISEDILPPPQQFRQSFVRSSSLDTCDIVNALCQRSDSDPQLSMSLARTISLRENVNNAVKLPSHEQDIVVNNGRTRTTSVGIKSWKSELLFNMMPSNDETSLVTSYDGCDHYQMMRGRDDRVTSLPRQIGSYRDLLCLSSSSSSLSLSEDNSVNDHDSVEISSISSFEMNEIKYSRVNIGHSAQVTIK